MKVKGISFFELHIEKFVLGAVVLAMAALAAMTFLKPGKTVTIDGQEVGAAGIDAALQRKAENLGVQLSDAAESTVAVPESPGVLAWFTGGLSAPVTPPDVVLASAGIPQYRPHIRQGDQGPLDQDFVVPTFVATGRPFATSYTDTLTADAVGLLPEDVRSTLFGEGADYDVSWATVASVLDLQSLRDQYAAKDPSGEDLQIPASWYRGQVYVWDVVLEREEQVNGGWTDRRTLAQLQPDLRNLRQQVEAEPPMRVGSKDALLDWLGDLRNQAFVIQPPFLETLGDSWSPPVAPDDRPGVDPNMAEISRMQNRIARMELDRDRVLERLNSLSGGGGNTGSGGGGSLPPPGGGGGGSLPPPGGGGGGGGAGGDLGNDEGGGGSTPTDRVQRRLQSQLDRLETAITRARDELADFASENGIVLNPEDAEPELPNLLRDDEVLVWAHDILATPGHIYRYRMTVRVYNPFFGQSTALMDPQKPLAGKVFMSVAASEWSEAVRVKEQTRYFVTRAQPNEGDFGIGRAQIEVYKLHDGQWTMQELDLQPGDEIGRVAQVNIPNQGAMTVDFSTEAFVLDVLPVPAPKGVRPGAEGGKVVISLPDGTTIVRDPRLDENDPERLDLLRKAGRVATP